MIEHVSYAFQIIKRPTPLKQSRWIGFKWESPVQAIVHFTLWAHLVMWCILDSEDLPGNSVMSLVPWHRNISFSTVLQLQPFFPFPFLFHKESLHHPPFIFFSLVRLLLELVHLEVQRLLNNLSLWECPHSISS